MNHWQTTLCMGAVLGFAGVLLGALGAHALRAVLAPAQLASYETAVRFHLYHALLLLVIGVWMRQAGPPRPFLRWAAVSVTAGVVCFSGSIYLLVAGAPRWLGPVTPVGGLLLMAGWLLLAAAAIRSARAGA